LVAFLEYRYGDRMGHFIMRFGACGPVAGALFGCLPQCGFSVVAAALYLKRLVSVGTLLAVFISTSDEAVPVLLTMPQKAPIVGLLIAIKVMIAIIAGITVDFFMNKWMNEEERNTVGRDKSYEVAIDEHKGCCSHVLSDRPSKIKALFWHPLMHTLKIYIFLLIFSVVLGFVVGVVGEARIGAMLLSGTVLQPVIAAFIGLIPNCFASVLLAELYAKNAISFGSLIAGLCASAGLGLLVLLKESKELKNALKIIGLLLTISIFAGIIIQWFGFFI
ncbi:MAG: putative manganese transporter, partial [Acetobacterium sp.]|nr:putative manganese transporter [Acetobacterium sp.]